MVMHLLLKHQLFKIHAYAGSLFPRNFATKAPCFSSAKLPKPHFSDPNVSSSSSSSSSPPPVFLSFRGEDTREGFVKFLHEALFLAGVRAFKDDVDLTKGCRIQTGLMDAIHDSCVFIPVISRNYASSKWCLQELAEIMKCVRMDSNGGVKTVFPVFYDVRPTQVRHLMPPFSAAFAKLEVDDDKNVNTWKRAMTELANFSGFDLLGTYQRDEAKCIEDIVEEVRNKQEAIRKEKVARIAGVEYHLRVLNSLLRMESSKDDVLFVGILGKGNSTTFFTKTIFDQFSDHFEGTYQVQVSNNSRKQEMVSLQKKLLKKISRKKNVNIMNVIQGMSMIKQKLCSKKALVILDGIGSIHQLRALVGSRDWYGPGSRIIVIATDNSVLQHYEMDEMYDPTHHKCLISGMLKEG